MKFAHIADVHIGNWRDKKLKNLVIEAFEKSIELCIAENVDFVVIAGDLFDTALPGIEMVKRVFRQLKKLKDANIPLYYIAGSHDQSPSGKTMLDVIEEADLGTDVMRGHVENNKIRLEFTKDEKTGAKITGLIGKAGQLDTQDYKDLDRTFLEDEDGFKIFLFHTTLSELKPKELKKVEGSPISFLPKNFDYYAGGHVHIVERYNNDDYKNVVYPGPVFPANFAELEKLESGGFYIYKDGTLDYQSIHVKNVLTIRINHEGTLQSWEKELDKHLSNVKCEDKIVLIRLEGLITDASKSDLNTYKHIKEMQEQNAFKILKKATGLKSKEFEEITRNFESNEDLENILINENLSDINIFEDEKKVFKQLIKGLASEKDEGEKVATYEKRILDEAMQIIDKSVIEKWIRWKKNISCANKDTITKIFSRNTSSRRVKL